MFTTRRTLALAAGTLSIALGLPTAAAAQRRLEPVRVTAEALARADSYHDKATALDGSLGAYKKIAHLHERSAELREVTDPKVFECTRTAALLRYYAGDRRRGADGLERAATLAADRGDVLNAANAFVDAAIVARELRQPSRMAALVERAELLASSPLLSDNQRLMLRDRLGRGGEVAALDVHGQH